MVYTALGLIATAFAGTDVLLLRAHAAGSLAAASTQVISNGASGNVSELIRQLAYTSASADGAGQARFVAVPAATKTSGVAAIAPGLSAIYRPLPAPLQTQESDLAASHGANALLLVQPHDGTLRGDIAVDISARIVAEQQSGPGEPTAPGRLQIMVAFN